MLNLLVLFIGHSPQNELGSSIGIVPHIPESGRTLPITTGMYHDSCEEATRGGP
jgi:hypothetical protein